MEEARKAVRRTIPCFVWIVRSKKMSGGRSVFRSFYSAQRDGAAFSPSQSFNPSIQACLSLP